MKTFIITILFITGGVFTLQYEGTDRLEAYEFASSMCTPFDTINIS